MGPLPDYSPKNAEKTSPNTGLKDSIRRLVMSRAKRNMKIVILKK